MYNFTGNETFDRRFLEFATVYKGSRPLLWGCGAKETFAKLGAGQKVRRDQQIINDPVPQADEVEMATISADTWYLSSADKMFRSAQLSACDGTNHFNS